MPLKNPCCDRFMPVRQKDNPLELTRSLISVRQLDEDDIRVGFSSRGWILHRGNLLLARGPKVRSLYPQYITLNEDDLFLVDILVLSQWQG